MHLCFSTVSSFSSTSRPKNRSRSSHTDSCHAVHSQMLWEKVPGQPGHHGQGLRKRAAIEAIQRLILPGFHPFLTPNPVVRILVWNLLLLVLAVLGDRPSGCFVRRDEDMSLLSSFMLMSLLCNEKI
nr:hypothetical protein CFP56_43755 [Quercus suber]